jgi:hypothetical protein
MCFLSESIVWVISSLRLKTVSMWVRESLEKLSSDRKSSAGGDCKMLEMCCRLERKLRGFLVTEDYAEVYANS